MISFKSVVCHLIVVSNEKKHTSSRRKALLTTAGLGSALLGFPGAASAKEEVTKNVNKNGYYYDKDGNLVIPDSELEKWEVVVVEEKNKRLLDDENPPESTEDAEIYVGENKNSVPPSQQVTTFSSRPPTYVTLASGNLPNDFPGLAGVGWKLSAGLRFNLARIEVTADITFTIGGVDIELWGVGVGYSDDKGYCGDVSPGSFPLTVEPCVNIQFGAEEVTVGGSVDICSPDIKGFTYCIGAVGFSVPVDVPSEVQNVIS